MLDPPSPVGKILDERNLGQCLCQCTVHYTWIKRGFEQYFSFRSDGHANCAK